MDNDGQIKFSNVPVEVELEKHVRADTEFRDWVRPHIPSIQKADLIRFGADPGSMMNGAFAVAAEATIDQNQRGQLEITVDLLDNPMSLLRTLLIIPLPMLVAGALWVRDIAKLS